MTKNAFYVFLLLLRPILQFVESDDRITLFPSLPITASSLRSNSCLKDSELYVSELKETTMWAAKMWDATAKSAEGILTGNTYQMGDFHECIETQAPFKTQYCLVTIEAHFMNRSGSYNQNNFSYPKSNNFTNILERITAPGSRSRRSKNYIKAAWCVPASCSIMDLKETLTVHLKNINTSLSSQGIVYTATLSEEDCQTYQPWAMDVIDITFCALTAILVIIVVSATIYDYYMERGGYQLAHKFQKTITAFSARKNLIALLKAEQHNRLSVLHGIRTVSCLSIIIIHRFASVGVPGISKNLDYHEDIYGGQHPLRLFFYRPDIVVDTFFTMSGILIANSVFRSTGREAIQPWRLILLRYMRLTPVYAYIVFYYATLFNFTGSGPLWRHYVTTQRQYCRKNWYLNLLYIHNYLKDKPETWCMVHTWSLASEFQFFIVGLLICVLIKYNKKAGFTLIFALIAASVVGTFIKIYTEERTAFMLTYLNVLQDPEFSDTYTKSHLRAAPYLIGLCFGYFYCKYYDPKRRMNVIQSVIMCIGSFAILLTVIISAARFYNQNQEYNALESAIYGALNRAVWSIAIGGIITVSTCGSITLLSEILSWKMWIPFSKLTYSAYIIHLQFQFRSVIMATYPIDLSIGNMLIQGAGDCICAFAAALVLFLIVETPFRIISNLFFVSGKTESKQRTLFRENAADSGKEKVKLK